MRTNRLIREKSPYLLQHAHNPVDWHAWGEEAFARARAQDKPIFLSVGYSTCHWCHVMERESFESEEVAEVLNRDFVPVKVDREERPDVDRLYMFFVQVSTGSGGWPMSVWLTPDLKPFFGGTYFPPDSRYGRPGFKAVLEYIANAWRADRATIGEWGAAVMEQLREHAAARGGGALDGQCLESCFVRCRRMFDSEHGGFGPAPKFPRPVLHNFLLRYFASTGNREALDMVVETLHAMRKGGMRDQLGGGFHRYSVDERWFVPHFEKMLYDQAQLAVSYLEAWQITRDERLAGAARDIFGYVLRDMTHPEGGFYSAEDADSAIDPANPHEKGEGAFYVWAWKEIESVLGPEKTGRFAAAYGLRHGGNVANDPQGEFAGKNLLFQAGDVEGLAEERAHLLAARSKRVRPHLDDKILTSWNALMISAFAKGAQALGDETYLEAARRAAGFLLGKMYDAGPGALLRRFRDGEAAIPGFLDDYAFLVSALLDLYETGFELGHLETAVKLAETMTAVFEDREHGAFFSSAEGDGNLAIRMKDDYDGAEPSGNSMAVMALLRLAEMTGRADFRASAERTLEAFATRLAEAPELAPQMAAALQFSRSKPKQVILAGERDAPRTREMIRLLGGQFAPHRTVLLIDSAGTQARLAAWLPAVKDMTRVGGESTAYVCENYACRLPARGLRELGELLK